MTKVQEREDESNIAYLCANWYVMDTAVEEKENGS